MTTRSSFLRLCAQVLLAIAVVTGGTAAVNAQDRIGERSRPHKLEIPYNVPPKHTGFPLEVPDYNTPILLMGTGNSTGFRGVGQATIWRTKPVEFLQWIAFDFADQGVPSLGLGDTEGQHICWLDNEKKVEVVVRDATHVSVRNNSTEMRKGVLIFIW